MGISTISKLPLRDCDCQSVLVSIPNGDKHDFKTEDVTEITINLGVSIPNGDKHDFKTGSILCRRRRPTGFNPQWG